MNIKFECFCSVHFFSPPHRKALFCASFYSFFPSSISPVTYPLASRSSVFWSLPCSKSSFHLSHHLTDEVPFLSPVVTPRFLPSPRLDTPSSTSWPAVIREHPFSPAKSLPPPPRVHPLFQLDPLFLLVCGQYSLLQLECLFPPGSLSGPPRLRLSLFFPVER